eukprot:339130-Rhodomonas_salina.2
MHFKTYVSERYPGTLEIKARSLMIWAAVGTRGPLLKEPALEQWEFGFVVNARIVHTPCTGSISTTTSTGTSCTRGRISFTAVPGYPGTFPFALFVPRPSTEADWSTSTSKMERYRPRETVTLAQVD